MGRVSGKVALVTGGGAGLGAADCELLAHEGATVIVSDIDFARAHAVAARIGNGAIARRQDVASEDGWKAIIADIQQTFGRLDVLVNNAGIVIVADELETTLEQFRRVNSIMSEGVFLGCKYSIPLMRSGGGSIINIASTASHLGYPDYFAYSAAKGAVRSMTKSIAIACQAQNYKIRCNSIHPSGIETALQRASEDRSGGDVTVRTTQGCERLTARRGQPRLFLASDESRFVTGAEYLIDNGATI
jgi:3(or 17)beta-hydroxysteroid dehydrogenase